jgi:hypothetical protein
MLRLIGVTVLSMTVTPLFGQTPRPFPRAGAPTAPAPREQVAPPQAPAPSAPRAVDPGEPTATTLGAPIHPSAQFLNSYDAGAGQRYYLFGVPASFAEVVGYYQTQIGQRGELIFKDPPTHQFNGEPFVRYRSETMVFAPGVTVKDWTSGGSPGYPNPRRGAQPARFPTIVMIVTPPPAAPAGRR